MEEKAKFIKMVLLKIISQTGTGYHGLFSVIDSSDQERYKKTIHLLGDFPVVPCGCVIDSAYEWNSEKGKGRIDDYKFDLTPHNRKLFESISGFDIETFKSKLEFHKTMGILWRKLEKTFDNPYAYYSFRRADRIFYKTNRPADSKIRLDAILKETVNLSRKCRKDHMTLEEYLRYVSAVEKMGAFKELPYIAKIEMLNSKYFTYDGVTITDVEIGEAQYYIEKDLHYRQKIKEELLSEDELKCAVTEGLDKEQIEAIRCLKNTTPSIVTGGAGVGKTTVVSAIINCFNQCRPLSNILLLAPTGRASRRLADVTGWPASTIHKALRLIPKDDGYAEFTMYSEHNKLPHDLVIVDESSMIDTMLMSQLLKAIKDEAKIIFVGDHQQLYPVGVGEPFFDFMNSEYCDVFRLMHNHRQSKNDIEKNARRANINMPFVEGEGVRIADVPWSYIPELLKKIERSNGELASPSQMQIVSPFNRINRKINSILQKSKDVDQRFSINDKVIATRNTEDYCNGDIGFVVGVPEHGLDIQFEDGRRIHVNQPEMDDIELAYSISIHKMQGSESSKIYLFLPKKQNKFIEKRLLYTAITRAKDKLFIYYYDEDEAKLPVIGKTEISKSA